MQQASTNSTYTAVVKYLNITVVAHMSFKNSIQTRPLFNSEFQNCSYKKWKPSYKNSYEAGFIS